jgi:cell division protein FtsI/penicillin-binding protein 2
MRRQVTIRVRIIALFIVLVSATIIGRLYYVQVVQTEHYLELAERQYVQTGRDLYARGSIFFTTKDNKLLSAASTKFGYLLAFNPTLIKNSTSTCEALSGLIAAGGERCLDLSSRRERTYVEVDRQVSPENAALIAELRLPGVFLHRNQWRYYPGGSVAARVVGFVGFTERSLRELHGKYGLERFYDDVLFRSGEVRTINLFAELFGGLGAEAYVAPDSDQGDLITTIEPTVARMLEGVLEKTHAKYQSEFTGAIIMNPKSGAIYAMSAVPGFDPNNRSGAELEQFRNPLVENVYEFGSTIKALTVAAGIDSGAIAAHSTYYDEGCIKIGIHTICNFDRKGRGTVDMQRVLNQSLNTGAAYIMSRMGRERFRDYFLNFRIGSETGIDLPNEAFGLVRNLHSTRDIEYATASFGQGIALTPIAATRALAALGNGGFLVTPHLVSGIRRADGSVKDIRYPRGASVISEETSEEISRILTRVVDEALLQGTVALPHHTIAAKTGTAQIPDHVRGGYYENDYLHSFFGYFPAYDPRFIVFMYTVRPQGVRYASETLTLPFMDIAKFLINYYSIPPDR